MPLSGVEVIGGLRRTDLRAAFRGALPSPDWPASSYAQVVVALFELAEWRPWLEDAAGLLDAADTARALRQRNASHREDLTLTYALHRLLLGARTGVDAVAVPLVRDALGCPRLRDSPMHTSLSHSGGWAAMAVTAAGPVGVDMEPIDRRAVMPEIAERLCHPSEFAALAGLASSERAAALLELWVRKEALLKAAGVGMAREMDTFCAPDGSVQQLSPPESGETQLRMLRAGPDVVAAVAAPPEADVESVWLRPRMEAGRLERPEVGSTRV